MKFGRGVAGVQNVYGILLNNEG